MSATQGAAIATSAPKASLSGLIAREGQRRRHRQLLWWGALLAVPALAVAMWLGLKPRPIPIEARFRLAPVTMGDVLREVRATGHVEAVSTVQIGAEISGRIATVEVDYNDRVKQGQVLARFDRIALEAQLAQMQAGIAAARAALEQAKTDREHTARDLARVLQLFASKARTTAA